MHLPLTAHQTQLTILEGAESTNTVLVAGSATAADFTTVLTTNQTAGKGRLGRVWVSAPGRGVALSVLLRPRRANGDQLELAAWSWFPLMAGLAMTLAVEEVLRAPSNPAPSYPATSYPAPSPVDANPQSASTAIKSTTLKWPNDVLVGGEKISGILAELLPAGDGLVIGAGVNLLHRTDELPIPTATSLVLQGAVLRGDALVDAVSSAYLIRLRALYEAFVNTDGNARVSGLWAAVTARCSTLGQPVRVHLPAGGMLTGIAVDLDDSGRLRLRSGNDDQVTAVSAGDVEHLRYE